MELTDFNLPGQCLVKHTNTSENSASNSGNMCNDDESSQVDRRARRLLRRPIVMEDMTIGGDDWAAVYICGV